MSGKLSQPAIEPWTDAPLRDPGKDLLEREEFLSMIVDLLKNLADSNDSSVVALAAPWGSGKSTLLNFLRPALEPHVKIVTFSPWSAEGSNAIQREFFASLLEAFPKGSHRRVRKNAKKLLRRSSTLLRSVPLGLGNGVAEFAKETLPEESWDKAFERLSNAINEARSKVVVIIDDVDRLQPDEVVTLMKMVRLTGRFPRTNYLLSYDHDSLVNTLAVGLRSDVKTAETYLEKIVQYPLSLPPAQQTHLQRIVFNEVRWVLDEAPEGLGPSPLQRFRSFYVDHMWESLNTPRACHRFCAQAKTYLSLAENEVDHADFLAVTFIRLHHPKIYAKIPRWKGRLVGTHYSVSPIQERHKVEAEWDELIKDCGYAGKFERLEARRAISALFPKMAGELGASADSSGKYRLCNPEYFDRFFTFSLPIGDVSDELIRAQIDGLRTGDISLSAPQTDTFDHPDVDIRMLSVQKGDLHSDWSTLVPSMNLVKFVAGSLARDKVQYDIPISPGLLKVGWLARLIDTNLEMTPEDVPRVVELFAAPASLGSALKRAMAIYYPQGRYLPTDRPVETVKEESQAPPEFLAQLTEAWQHRAADWLAEVLTTKSYSISDREVLEVWSDLEFLGGLGFVRVSLKQKIESQTFDLVTVAAHFAYRGTWQNEHFYFGSNGEAVNNLDIQKLEEILPLEILRNEPLSTEDDPLSPKSGIAYLRRRRAIEGLLKYRERLSQTLVEGS